jgi:hypothetical protein
MLIVYYEGFMGWIRLPKDRDYWHFRMSTLEDLRVLQTAGNE